MILEKSREYDGIHVGDIVYVEQGVREVKVQIYRQKDRDVRWAWVCLDEEPLTECDIPHKYKLEDFIPSIATNATGAIQRNDIFSDACNTLQKLYNQYVEDNKVFDPRSRCYGFCIIVGLSDDYDRGDYMGTTAQLANLRTGEIFYISDRSLRELRPRNKARSCKIVFDVGDASEEGVLSLDYDLDED